MDFVTECREPTDELVPWSLEHQLIFLRVDRTLPNLQIWMGWGRNNKQIDLLTYKKAQEGNV